MCVSQLVFYFFNAVSILSQVPLIVFKLNHPSSLGHIEKRDLDILAVIEPMFLFKELTNTFWYQHQGEKVPTILQAKTIFQNSLNTMPFHIKSSRLIN